MMHWSRMEAASALSSWTDEMRSSQLSRSDSPVAFIPSGLLPQSRVAGMPVSALTRVIMVSAT